MELRESSYGQLRAYRMHIGTFPRPLRLSSRWQEGEEVDVKFIDRRRVISHRNSSGQAGVLSGDVWPTKPAEFPRYRSLSPADGVIAPSGNKVRMPFPNVLEEEPNNSVGEARLSDTPLPVAFNGIIGEPGDQDWFRFTAKKGQRYDVRVYARKLRSPIDSVIYICNKDGRSLASNDDSGGPDSYISWTVPADGEYTLRVRDHLNNGGSDYTYRVEFQPARPNSVCMCRILPGTIHRLAKTLSWHAESFSADPSARRTSFGGELL